MSTNQSRYPSVSSSLKKAEAKFPEILARDYARILQRIELLWGSKEAINYLDSIFLGDSQDRSGRQGFPIEVMNEIVQLKQMHEFLFPSLDVNPYDPFSGYTLPAPAKNIYKRATDSTTTAANASPTTMPPSAAPITERRLRQRTDWPELKTQREFIVKAELLRGGKPVYEQQGKPLGEILMHFQLIDGKTLSTVRQTQQEPSHKNKSFGHILVKVGIISHDELMRALCIQAGILMVDILNISIPHETLRHIPSNKAREKQAIPVCVYDSAVFLAVADPVAFKDHFFFSKLTGLKTIPVLALRHNIVNRLNTYN